MTNKLYVGNLPYETTNEDLEKTFSEVGSVASANIITDKFSGRSKGFGFVEMGSEEEAKQAVEKFNGFELNGRALVVNEARPMTDKKPRNDYNN